MLELRPNCECCDKDLPPDSREAMICTFECTFCTDCVEEVLDGRCPNCGGELVRRPVRPAAHARQVPGIDETCFESRGLRAERRHEENRHDPR